MRLIPQFIRTIQANNRNRRLHADQHAMQARSIYILSVPMMDPKRMNEEKVWALRDECAAMRLWMFMIRSRYLKALHPMGVLDHLIYHGEIRRTQAAMDKLEAELETLFNQVTAYARFYWQLQNSVELLNAENGTSYTYDPANVDDLRYLIDTLSKDLTRYTLKELANGSVHCTQG